MFTYHGDDPTGVRHGITRFLGWLNEHPTVPVAFVHYADELSVELTLPAGRFDAVTFAADTADALSASNIEVTDPRDKRVVCLTITGTVPSKTAPQLEIVACVSVYDDARKALLAALGAPPIPSARMWNTTSGELREVVHRGCVR